MGTPTTKTEVLLTILREISKQHIEYDVSSRISRIFTAPSEAIGGDPCHVREFLYYGVTLTVKGRKEGYAAWDSAWDSPPSLVNFLVDDLSNQLTDDLGDYLMEL